jgi:hypothetical protein
MSVHELHQLAEKAGVFASGNVPSYAMLDEPKLIRAIQKAHGQDDCFRTDQRFFCRNQECEWRSKCLKLVASWRS